MGGQAKRLYLVAALVLTSGCDQDPFGLSYRTIRGEFSLHRFAEGGVSYYLVDSKNDEGGYRALQGSVGHIGWNDRYILAWQNDDSGEAGWMIIDAETKAIEGRSVDLKRESDARLDGIVPVDAEAAWKKLESGT